MKHPTGSQHESTLGGDSRAPAEGLWSSRWRGSWRRRSRGWVEQHEGLVSHQAWPIEWPAHHCFLTSNKCQAAWPCFCSAPTRHPYKQLCQPAWDPPVRLLSTNGTGNRFCNRTCVKIFYKSSDVECESTSMIRYEVLRLIWILWPLKGVERNHKATFRVCELWKKNIVV